MYRNVIVGVDGHPTGRDAIALARRLAGPEAQLTLAHVESPEIVAAEVYRLTFAAGDDSTSLLERERAATGVDADLVNVPAQTVGRGLHELTATHGADLLVVGSCGRGPFGRALLGNDTWAAINGSACAVAIAPSSYAHTDGAIATIGVGYDRTPESRAALVIARELAAAHKAGLRALRVVPVPTAPYAELAGVAWGAALDDALDLARRRMAALEGVDGAAVLGLAGEELTAFGAGLDLLVVGSHGYGPLHRLLLGSTSQHLVGHARCPLLILPRMVTDAERDAEQADVVVAA